jgi:PAS domain S-box-containing protein
MCLAISFIPVGIIGGIQGFQSQSNFLIGIIFIVTAFVSLVISYFITKPLEKLTKNIDQISKGKLDVNLDYSEIKEINNLTDSLNRVMASLKLAIVKVGVKKGEIFEDAIKAKEEVENKQKDIFDSIHGWVWETDDKTNIVFCSDNISKILGYKPNEITGKNLYDLLDADYAKQAKQAFNDAVKNKKPIKNLEIQSTSKKGENKYFLLNAVPFFKEDGKLSGFRGVDTDITSEKIKDGKIKELNSDLSELKMEITNLLNQREGKGLRNKIKTGEQNTIKLEDKWSEHEFDAVFIFDENANILDCNDNMSKRLGYSKSEILSLNISDIDALESKNDIIDKIKKTKKEGVVSFKTIHKRKDGSAILVHENLQYNKDKNQFKGIVREDYSLKKSSK